MVKVALNIAVFLSEYKWKGTAWNDYLDKLNFI